MQDIHVRTIICSSINKIIRFLSRFFDFNMWFFNFFFYFHFRIFLSPSIVLVTLYIFCVCHKSKSNLKFISQFLSQILIVIRFNVSTHISFNSFIKTSYVVFVAEKNIHGSISFYFIGCQHFDFQVLYIIFKKLKRNRISASVYNKLDNIS